MASSFFANRDCFPLKPQEQGIYCLYYSQYYSLLGSKQQVLSHSAFSIKPFSWPKVSEFHISKKKKKLLHSFHSNILTCVGSFCISCLSVAGIKHHDQKQLKNSFWLTVSGSQMLMAVGTRSWKTTSAIHWKHIVKQTEPINTKPAPNECLLQQRILKVHSIPQQLHQLGTKYSNT